MADLNSEPSSNLLTKLWDQLLDGSFRRDLRNFLFLVLPRHVGSLVLLAVFWMVLSNAIGEGLGLSNIFRDRADVQNAYNGANWNSPTFWTSAIIMFSSCLMLVFPAFESEFHALPGGGRTAKISRESGSLFFVIGSCLLYVFLAWVWWNADSSPVVPGEWRRVPLGFAAGAIIFGGCYWFGRLLRKLVLVFYDSSRFSKSLKSYRMPLSQQTGLRMAFITPMMAVIGTAFFAGNLIPGVALLSLILFIFLVVKLFWVLPPIWRGGLVWLSFLMLFASQYSDEDRVQLGRDNFKHSFDGIVDINGDNHYDAALNLEEADSDERQCGLAGSFQGIELRDTLEAWHARQVRIRGDERPKLVIVATSGGAYRASYWTTLVLDRLIQANVKPELEGIADSVRLITGASGGMVGAAYFAALATEEPKMASQANITQALSRDIIFAQQAHPDRQRPAFYSTRYPVPRDSLSGVAQHLLQHDLASIFSSGLAPDDRGKVLENQWLELATPMSDFAEGERAGWRPSILFSPMIVETGQQLLISNLNLDFLPSIQKNEAVDMFEWFPCARDTFQVNTAVRMNATFPFISPAVSLPTMPKRRVVDAGYYDNYGISLVNALMSQSSAECVAEDSARGIPFEPAFCFRDWVAQKTSGILLVEIRAFGLGTDDELGAECEPASASSNGHMFEFLTSPVEAVLSARSRSMVFQNEQGRRRIQQMDSNLRLHRVIFVHCGDGTMNWIVPPDEFAQMQTSLDSQWEANERRLVKVWNTR